jgi:ferredoxin
MVENPGLRRIMPYYKALEGNPDFLPYEDIREVLKTAKRIAMVPCLCRRYVQACEMPMDVCLQFDERAEYIIDRGCGRELSYEEALAAIDEAEEGGLIHLVGNKRSGHSYICNCCVCCCVVFRPFNLVGKLNEIDAKSRYEASVDQELCDGCQVCIDRCQMGAIDMVRIPSSKKLKADVDSSKCIGCGACVITCPEEALSLVAVRPPEFIPEIAPVVDTSTHRT